MAVDPWDKLDEMMDTTIPELIAKAVAAERERSAKAAEDWLVRWTGNLALGRDCAAFVRRGE